MLDISIGRVDGLPERELSQLMRLIEVYRDHQAANQIKNKYYEGHVTLGDVNLGIALPHGLRGLEVGCSWGAKCVDVLASRSMFDGFVAEDGTDATTMQAILYDNNLIYEYGKACRDELKYGCTFATLSRGGSSGVRIRWHTPQTAAAIWDGEHDAIECGFAVISIDNDETKRPLIKILNLYTPDATWVLRHTQNADYAAERVPHDLKTPLMVPFIWNATSEKPFGRSRLKKSIRELINAYVRTVANATIGLEFATSPQKYLLGVTDEQYDAVVSQKFRQYIGSIIAATTNPETGQNPVFGQLTQGSIQPHVDMIRILATQFSAATGLTVTEVGVVNDANPTSSEAILAQSQTLVTMAEQLNSSNGYALRRVAILAQAIAADTTVDALEDRQRNVLAHFKNPSMPSVSVTADAAIKIASSRKEFASTDTFLEMIGFSQADIRRIRAQEQRVRGQALLEDIMNRGEPAPAEEPQEDMET